MPVSRRKKIYFYLGLMSISLLTAAFFLWKNFQRPSPEPVTEAAPTMTAPPAVEAATKDTQTAMEEAGDTEPDDNSCHPENTFGEGEKKDRTVSPDLQFKASVLMGDRVTYSLPFALKPGQAFSLAYESEDASHESGQCVTDGQTVRCTEIFWNASDSYCGPLKLADGTEKFVQFFLELKDRPAPLPPDLDTFAIKKEGRGLGVFAERLRDTAQTAASGLPAYLPIQIWESSDPSAKMIGEVPSGFFLLAEYSDAVYIEKVGERYLTNLLSTKLGNSAVPQVYHWISNVKALSYEDIVTEGGLFCLNFITAYCKYPSEKDCQNVEDSMKDFNRNNYEVDKSQPILRNERDWVVLKPKTQNASALTTIYVRLHEYYKEATLMCD